MDKLKIKNIALIEDAEIKFEDLTILVGSQATGKSIILQLLKLIEDKKHIQQIVEQYGLVWGNDKTTILNRFFGEGMSEIWKKNTSIEYNETKIAIQNLYAKKAEKKIDEKIFYIPAQRVICLQNGWPRFFKDYENSVPYVLRYFSETLRQLVDKPKSESFFFQKSNLFNENIFHNAKIEIEKENQKRFKLDVGKSSIPFMAWSAGQKEFMPLFLSFFYLGSIPKKKRNIKYIIIEEPEMGLHPQAIESIILQIIILLSMDYKIILSTHSPMLLEFAWAFSLLKRHNVNINSLFEMFDSKNMQLRGIKGKIEAVFKTKNIKTYYFDRNENKVEIKDISSLDAGAEDESIANWGGLSSFSAKATDIVFKNI